MKMDCPLCLQLRNSLYQIITGVMYPSVTGTILISLSAIINKSMDIPSLKNDHKRFFQFYKNIFKSGALKFHGIITGHVLLALFLPYMQSLELQNIMDVVRMAESSNNQ